MWKENKNGFSVSGNSCIYYFSVFKNHRLWEKSGFSVFWLGDDFSFFGGGGGGRGGGGRNTRELRVFGNIDFRYKTRLVNHCVHNWVHVAVRTRR